MPEIKDALALIKIATEALAADPPRLRDAQQALLDAEGIVYEMLAGPSPYQDSTLRPARNFHERLA